jgi:hypothetical protein
MELTPPVEQHIRLSLAKDGLVSAARFAREKGLDAPVLLVGTDTVADVALVPYARYVAMCEELARVQLDGPEFDEELVFSDN